MSENESFTINDLMKKIIIISKNVKALSELAKTIDEKLNTKPADNKSKEDMDEIFKKKSIGRPAGSFEDKQKQYMDMLNKNKIKSPKPETIEYYKLFKNEEGKYELI